MTKEFSFSNYADDFDDHISTSIRGYADLRDDIISISRYFIENETRVVDIGCSAGSLLKRIKDANTQAPEAHYVGIDINDSFSKHWVSEPNLDYRVDDIRQWNGLTDLSLAISVFTFQFVPERDRLRLMQNIYDNLVDGGAFVFSEKIFSHNAKMQNMLEFMYYDFKRKTFTETEILSKEQELRHLAKNTTENHLIKQLRSIGFRGIQVFWRNFNFIGVVAMKRSPVEGDEE